MVELNHLPADTHVSDQPDLLSQALAYAKKGTPVFPLKPKGKAPITPNGFKDATTDPTTIIAWWTDTPDANIGIPTGLASGLFVVDCDYKVDDAGNIIRDGITAFRELQDIHEVVDTRMVHTGSGEHHYFSCKFPEKFRHGNSSPWESQGIDVRGDGGYIVAVPSVHPNGEVYEWDDENKPLMGVPSFVKQALKNPKLVPVVTSTTSDEKISEGERNNTLYRYASKLRGDNFSEEQILALLVVANKERCDPLLPYKELQLIAQSASKYSPNELPMQYEPMSPIYTDYSEWDVIIPTDIHYQRDGTPDLTIIWRAKDIKKLPSGTYAQVEICLNETLLARSRFNVDDLNKSQQLARLAFERFNSKANIWVDDDPNQKLVNQLWFQSWIDDCSRNLFNVYVSQNSATELIGDLTLEVVMALGNFIIEGGGSILYGDGGTYKSYIAIAMALSMKYGYQNIWNVPKKRTPLLVNLERSEKSIQRRIGRIGKALELSSSASLLTISSTKSLSDLRYVIEREIKEHGVDVLILDSLSRSGGGDLVTNEVANSTVDLLNDLCPTWLAIGHSTKASATAGKPDLYGSVMWRNGADVAIQVTADGGHDLNGAMLRVTKANDFKIPPVHRYALEFGTNGLTKIRTALENEFPELESTAKTANTKEQVIEYLSEVEGGSDYVTNIAQVLELHRPTVQEVLTKSPEFEVAETGEYNRKYYRLVNHDASE